MKNSNIVEADQRVKFDKFDLALQRVIKALDVYKLTIAFLAGIDTSKPEAVKAFFAAQERNKTIGRLVRAELARLRRLYLESYK